jgi:hypothetical protein
MTIIPLHQKAEDGNVVSLRSYLDSMLYYLECVREDLARQDATAEAGFRLKPVLGYVDARIQKLMDTIEHDCGEVSLVVEREDVDEPLRVMPFRAPQKEGAL